MIEIMGRLQSLMAAMSAAEVAAAGRCEYSAVEAQLDALGASVQGARAADEAEANSLWTNLKGALLHGFNYGAEKARFESQAARAKAEAEALLTQVRTMCATHVGVHAGVPDQLLADHREWIRNRQKVYTQSRDCARLREVPGWDDAAKPQYQAAVDVQLSALAELEGIMMSTAQSCKAGAQLNRAVFFVVAKAIRLASGSIDGAPGGGGLTYYRRTAAVIQVLRSLRGEIRGAVSGDVADGAANALSQEIRHTVTMPHLLKVGSWPTGTNGAGRAPADTRNGVRGDGSDADLGVDNDSGETGGGVRL